MPRRFPLRTIVLMFLALAAFVWFYWNTHQPQRRPQLQEVQVVPMGGDR